MEARDVGGHDVGGELGALEVQARDVGQGGGQGGLTRAGDVLDQHVGTGQKGGQKVEYLGALAYDYLLHLVGGGNHLGVGRGHFGGQLYLGGLVLDLTAHGWGFLSCM